MMLRINDVFFQIALSVIYCMAELVMITENQHPEEGSKIRFE